MKINPTIFREYDVRGIAGDDISPEFAHRLGLAYAKILRETVTKPANGKNLRLAIGKDCRLTSGDYAKSLVQGVREGGVDVVFLGMVPTPLMYFSIFHLDTDGGIIVTASHNPSEFNGFKICLERRSFFGAQIQQLRKTMESNPEPAATQGRLSEHKIEQDYLNWVENHTGPFPKKLKVVLDAGNATASQLAPALFERLGVEIVPLYCELDGRFPNHHPDPTVAANLKDLIATVKKERADFGVAYDGDSDRIGAVDENGRIIFGDELMILFSRSVLEKNPGATIISEVKSSQRLYDDISARGGKPIMWRTGHSIIKTKMKETKAALAGEMSGHIFFADRFFGFDDAIYSSVRLLEIVSQAKGPLSSLLADVPPMLATPEIRVACEEELKFKLVEETTARLKASPEGFEISDIDGIRISKPECWGLIRASNTQAVLVLRYEATDEPHMKAIREKMEKALSQAVEKLGHPVVSIERQ